MFIRNLERYGLRHKVVLHIGFSQLILPQLAPTSFDFAFIDAQHQLEPVREDLEGILPLLREGAVLAFHDYGSVEFGVTPVVDELATSRNLSVGVIGTLAVVRLGG